MRLYCTILAAAAALAAAPPARADFVIAIGSATVTHGSTAAVDVTVTGPDLLDFYVAEFRIDAVGPAAPAGLRFTVPPADVSADPDYAMFGNSLGYGVFVISDPLPDDTLTAVDLTNDGLGADVSGTKLLARLNLSALAGLTDGWQYRISLFGSFQRPLGAEEPEIAYETTGGLITIDGVPPGTATTPPPATALAALAGLCGFAAARRRRAQV